MKKEVLKAIDDYREKIIGCGEYILNHPEMGYKEYETSAFIKSELDGLGLTYKDGLAVTGVKATAGQPGGINVCIIGEMDAVKCFGHPHADKETGAAHACGHNAQVAAMLGAAYGLVKSGAIDKLCGRVTFFAVPAEEFAEFEYREQLKNEGKIEFYSGKQELIRLGEFDDIDIAMMIHAQAGAVTPELYMMGESLGFSAKKITFKGKAAHGSEPFDGVNALNAAMLALMGIHANRETFRDEDRVRIHPIITNGGELVNVVPAKTEIETYVRGANNAAIADACKKVDNAVRAGAMAVGAECEIKDIRGYMPLLQNESLSRALENNARELLGAEHVHFGVNSTGSTDMGDLCALMPGIQPTMGGFAGSAHGVDFAVTDAEAAYILPAKLLALTVCDLLSDNAELAGRIKGGSLSASVPYLVQKRM